MSIQLRAAHRHNGNRTRAAGACAHIVSARCSAALCVQVRACEESAQLRKGMRSHITSASAVYLTGPYAAQRRPAGARRVRVSIKQREHQEDRHQASRGRQSAGMGKRGRRVVTARSQARRANKKHPKSVAAKPPPTDAASATNIASAAPSGPSSVAAAERACAARSALGAGGRRGGKPCASAYSLTQSRNAQLITTSVLPTRRPVLGSVALPGLRANQASMACRSYVWPACARCVKARSRRSGLVFVRTGGNHHDGVGEELACDAAAQVRRRVQRRTLQL